MTDAMFHRGPDDGAVEMMAVHNGWLALGARRLAIQDLTHSGHQPMCDYGTGNWVVFNGEIYNFQALRAQLERGGEKFQSATDTEVLLKGYALWGLKTISLLRGMFAFALWDAVAQRLILGRDRLGVKPLYYRRRHDGVVFASEVRALLASGMVPRQLSMPGLVSFLALGAVQEPATMLEDIWALPAGHYAVVANGEFRLHRYWSLKECFEAQRPTSVDRREVVDDVRSTLATAVKLRLISDAPIGTFLSGGLDSSAVTALAAQHSRRPVRTMSVIFHEEAFSEKRYIDLVSRRYATEHTEIRLSPDDFSRLVPGAVDAMDQPTFDGVNTYVVSREARLNGLTVALSGIGADELFGGYPAFRRVSRLNLMRRLTPRVLRNPISAVVSDLGRGSDRARSISRWVNGEADVNGALELLMRELFSPRDRERLISGLDASVTVNGGCSCRSGPLDDFNSVSYFELSHYMRNVLLRDTDTMGMAHALEVREPLLDQELVQLIAGLPGGMKRAGGRKALLVQAMRGQLPEQVLRRKKMGFTLPFAQWLRGPLGQSVGEVLMDSTVGGQVSDVLDGAAVKDVWHRFVEGSATWVRPWSLHVLKLWGAANLL